MSYVIFCYGFRDKYGIPMDSKDVAFRNDTYDNAEYIGQWIVSRTIPPYSIFDPEMVGLPRLVPSTVEGHHEFLFMTEDNPLVKADDRGVTEFLMKIARAFDKGWGNGS